jgi:hypothetical protein
MRQSGDDDDNAHFAANPFPRAMMMMRGNHFGAEGPQGRP